MFTGIIEDIGRVERSQRSGNGARVRIATRLAPAGLAPGDSICVEGVCLTVAELGEGAFGADVSCETLQASTLGSLRAGQAVHLERALALGGRLGGHIVTGHVDGVGEIRSAGQRGDSIDMQIQAPPGLAPLLVPKGSVAVAGVSLTVNRPAGGLFGVTLVPHTLSRTTLGDRRPGERLNLEADILGKYVRHLLSGAERIDEAFLAEHGFL
ncbi:MAG: riboflavin synthase [Deltaproteobacteria bacterium]|nr:riboflavin synthase [Deltaproteobacteria bacterium]